jgi:hypothetical protein
MMHGTVNKKPKYLLLSLQESSTYSYIELHESRPHVILFLKNISKIGEACDTYGREER